MAFSADGNKRLAVCFKLLCLLPFPPCSVTRPCKKMFVFLETKRVIVTSSDAVPWCCTPHLRSGRQGLKQGCETRVCCVDAVVGACMPLSLGASLGEGGSACSDQNAVLADLCNDCSLCFFFFFTPSFLLIFGSFWTHCCLLPCAVPTRHPKTNPPSAASAY